MGSNSSSRSNRATEGSSGELQKDTGLEALRSEIEDLSREKKRIKEKIVEPQGHQYVGPKDCSLY